MDLLRRLSSAEQKLLDIALLYFIFGLTMLQKNQHASGVVLFEIYERRRQKDRIWPVSVDIWRDWTEQSRAEAAGHEIVVSAFLVSQCSRKQHTEEGEEFETFERPT